MSSESELDGDINQRAREFMAQRAAAAAQLMAEMETLANSLGAFRRYLKDNGFTDGGAENHTLELFVRWLEAPNSSDDED